MKAMGHSLVRFVNATSGGGISVQLSQQTLFNDVTSGTVTDYREISTSS